MKDVNFIGYTFNRNVENQRSSLVAALIDLETSKQSALSKPSVSVSLLFSFNAFPPPY